MPSSTTMLREWLVQHPRWTFHFTPTSASWLNAVEGVSPLVVRHSGFDGLIPSQVRIGKFSGGTRISMLLGAPA
jgi:hypothetical protein